MQHVKTAIGAAHKTTKIQVIHTVKQAKKECLILFVSENMLIVQSSSFNLCR